MDACAHALAVILLLALSGCAAPRQDSPAKPPRQAPFAGCLPVPPDLPPIATVAQLRADRDALRKLYLNCSERARRNAAAAKE